ncbi:class I SAM-dependent methyltransferase [Enterococcus wangshanyuanii]|uniref:S-adenosylmethionine-dependent methyltransferase n=1 Tax=Enterococcus wangshanyuanii TaxID=2005703 RepID=A0ABQ1PUQ1_9ENTE|nr:class I SAM-dependent methyltransferase [Enterococcus wangshanyuanii]GGD04047.1 S-adenosylmethionine-dependent methyltransferase [Enterococcus wangshanyuanii]
MSVFDRIASHYDSPKQLELAQIILNELENSLGETNEKTLLDYGCGTGLIGLPLADRFEKVTLIDPSKEMITIVEQKVESMALKNTKAMIDHFSKEHIPEITADIIIVSLVLLHIPDTKEILEALYQVLNPKGYLLIVDFDTNEKARHEKVHSGFDQNKLKAMLETIGYQSIQSNTFYHGEELFMRQDASMFVLRAEK